jgi:glutamate--cysteine ligase catalytic subunit
MGLLTLGTPYNWNEVQPFIQHVKHHGIKQFLNIYHSVKVRRLDNALWGEELEFIVVKFDQENKRVTLLLDADQTLEKLQDLETRAIKNGYRIMFMKGVRLKAVGSLNMHGIC